MWETDCRDVGAGSEWKESLMGANTLKATWAFIGDGWPRLFLSALQFQTSWIVGEAGGFMAGKEAGWVCVS